MPLSFLSSLIGGGGGLGFNDSSTSSNTNTNQNSNANTNTSGSTQRTLTPFQNSIQAPLFNYVTNAMTPAGAEATIAPYTAAARDSTSQNYSGLADMLRQQFLGTGGGNSGKFGSALVQGNLARLGALQGVDTAGQEQAAQLPLEASSIASGLLGMNFGQTTTGASSSTSATTGTSSTKSSSSGFSL
jgi:hypothetical protein